MRNKIFIDEYESYFDCPPLTEQAVQEAEQDLGVRLPPSLVELLRVRNGGYIFAELPLPDGEHREYLEDRVSFMGIMGICPENGIGKRLNDVLRRSGGYPENTVIFSYFGHTSFALDYHKEDAPSVLYAYYEIYPKVLMVEVAPNFQAFLDNLILHEWDT